VITPPCSATSGPGGGGRGQTDSNGGPGGGGEQAKIRQGEVIAGEREAVAKGLQKSILEIKDAVPGVSESDVLAILALTRHYDTRQAIGASDHNNTILVPHTPDAVGALMSQWRNTFAVGSVMGQRPHRSSKHYSIARWPGVGSQPSWSPYSVSAAFSWPGFLLLSIKADSFRTRYNKKILNSQHRNL
jgi:hypothetical protein